MFQICFQVCFQYKYVYYRLLVYYYNNAAQISHVLELPSKSQKFLLIEWENMQIPTRIDENGLNYKFPHKIDTKFTLAIS